MTGKLTSPLITKLLDLYTEFMNDEGNVSLSQISTNGSRTLFVTVQIIKETSSKKKKKRKELASLRHGEKRKDAYHFLASSLFASTL